jgi:hypothetical protein
MDSNFQVTIQASVEGLRKSIKEAQGVLAQFEVSANKAASATKGVEREANRGRLAAFAFGQVIRDAGFFSQSFGLGLLAISNNIPILIDQLVILSKVSESVGGAISLVGSVLTAALTIWAYSASAIKKTSEAINSLGKSAGDEIGHLTALYSAATDVNRPMSERYKIIAKLQELYPSYFGNLSKEAIAAGKAASSYRALRDEIINVAVAKASEEVISKKAEELANAIIDAKKQELEIRKKFPKATEGEIARLMGQSFAIDEVNGKFETQWERVNRLKKEIQDLGSLYASVAKDFTSAAIIGDFGKVGGNEIKDSIQKQLEEALKAIQLDPTLSKIEKVTASIDAYKTALKALVDEGYKKNKVAIDNVVSSLSKLDSELSILKQKEEGQKAFNATLEAFWKITDDLSGKRLDIYSAVDTKKSQQIKQDIESTSDALNKYLKLSSESPDLNAFLEMQTIIDALKAKLAELGVSFESAINTENAADKLKKFNDAILGILNTGIVDAFSSSFMAIGDAISRGGNIADAAGAALLGTIANMAQQLGELAIGFGITIKSIKLSLKSLNPFVAIAAGVALLTLAGYARNRASAIAGSGGGGSSSSTPSGGAFGGVRPFAKGGIISGDTLGLMGEYPNARSNPEVVAPLDKLTSLISGSIGDIGGNMSGQLTARISGNDLVILLDRASKNRKNYF